MSPLTVVLPTCNRSNYLRRILPTIFAQTFRDFDLVVIDNASTDDTEQVVRSFDDPRLSYVRHERNIGGVGNLNFAIEQARSEFLIILHDDDLLAPTLFEREIAELRADPDLAMVTCNGHLIDEEDAVTAANVLGMPTIDFAPLEYCSAYIGHGKNLFLPAHMYRTARLHALGLRFRADVGNGMDAFFVNTLNLTERIRFLDEPLFSYRVHQSQWCRQLHDALRAGFELWTAFRDLAMATGRLDALLPQIVAKLRDSFGFYFLSFCFSEGADAARLAEFETFVRSLPPEILDELAADPKVRVLLGQCAPSIQLRRGRATSNYEWADANWRRNQRAFGAWEYLRAEGRDLARPLLEAGVRKVAIFGATAIGYLLQREFAEQGIAVIAVLENRPENLGLHFSGCLVHSPAWLEEHGRQVDAVVTACFSGGERSVAETFRQYPLGGPAWIVGWRDLLLLRNPALLLSSAALGEVATTPPLLKVA